MTRISQIAGIVIILAVVAPIAASGQTPAEDSTVRIDTTLISVPVIVSDRQGRYVSGLGKDDFRLSEDGVERPVAFFASVEEPINIALLLDTSRSTHLVLEDIKKAARLMLARLRPVDRAMIVSFDYRVQVLSRLTGDKRELERAVDRARIGEYIGTTMYDAVAEVTEGQFRGVSGRKAIILLTDGKDAGSQVSSSELLESAAESDTLIYSVFYSTGMPAAGGRRDRFPWGDRLPQRRNRRAVEQRQRRVERINRSASEYLQSLSDSSAGRFYQSDVADLAETFGLVVDELRRQYRLGFYPDEGNLDGEAHQLRVRVNRTDVAVRARKSYRVTK